MKQCFKCKATKPFGEFYEHPDMSDGHLGKCKECTRRDVKERVDGMPDKGKAYEKQRNQKEERKKARRRYSKEHRLRYPQKRRARVLLGNAVRSGKIKRGACERCGVLDAEAHHPDYSKPLEVIWLCVKHHKELHNNGKPT